MVEQPDSAEPSSQTDRPAGVGPRLAVAVGAAALVGMAAFFAGRWLHRKPAGPTASVTLLSQPTGASAHMDRKFVGVTPVTCKDVPYGEHKLLLKKDGYGPRPLRILISKPQESFSATLDEATESTLKVTSEPTEAKVYLGGRYLGFSPLLVEGLPSGKQELRIEKGDCKTWRRMIVLKPRKTASWHADLASAALDRLQADLRDDPSDLRRHVDLARHWLKQGEFEEAAEVLSRAWRVAQVRRWDEAGFQGLRGEIRRAYCGELDLPGEAPLDRLRPLLAEVLHEAIAAKPTNSVVVAYAAGLFSSDAQAQAGAEVLEALHRRCPGNVDILRALCQVRAKQGAIENTVSHLERLRAMVPRDWRVLRQLGHAYNKAGQHAKARQTLEACLLYCDDEAGRQQVRALLASVPK